MWSWNRRFFSTVMARRIRIFQLSRCGYNLTVTLLLLINSPSIWFFRLHKFYWGSYTNSTEEVIHHCRQTSHFFLLFGFPFPFLEANHTRQILSSVPSINVKCLWCKERLEYNFLSRICVTLLLVGIFNFIRCANNTTCDITLHNVACEIVSIYDIAHFAAYNNGNNWNCICMWTRYD